MLITSYVLLNDDYGYCYDDGGAGAGGGYADVFDDYEYCYYDDDDDYDEI